MHHLVSAVVGKSMRTLLVGSAGGKLARRRGSYRLSRRQAESWKWAAACPDPGSPSPGSAAHKQGPVNERETDFTTNSLAVVGGDGGGGTTPAGQFSMDAITCRNERQTEKYREKRLHFQLTATGRT